MSDKKIVEKYENAKCKNFSKKSFNPNMCLAHVYKMNVFVSPMAENALRFTKRFEMGNTG